MLTYYSAISLYSKYTMVVCYKPCFQSWLDGILVRKLTLIPLKPAKVNSIKFLHSMYVEGLVVQLQYVGPVLKHDSQWLIPLVGKPVNAVSAEPIGTAPAAKPCFIQDPWLVKICWIDDPILDDLQIIMHSVSRLGLQNISANRNGRVDIWRPLMATI